MRLIPAWAGKTSFSPFDSLLSCGSSPRGRGKRERVTNNALQARLIPAWAGKTSKALLTRRRNPAHPRVGGENGLSVTEKTPALGSSPRGRGKRSPPARRGQAVGLIPAWAGKTPGRPDRRPQATAHPRVGGENSGNMFATA